MDEPHYITDSDLEQLFAGWEPAEEDEAALRSFLRDFDVACPKPSTSHLEAAHLSAMSFAPQDPPPRR
jgi:hypothetical protein